MTWRQRLNESDKVLGNILRGYWDRCEKHFDFPNSMHWNLGDSGKSEHGARSQFSLLAENSAKSDKVIFRLCRLLLY